jgi:hypothetical protein
MEGNRCASILEGRPSFVIGVKGADDISLRAGEVAYEHGDGPCEYDKRFLGNHSCPFQVEEWPDEDA